MGEKMKSAIASKWRHRSIEICPILLSDFPHLFYLYWKKFDGRIIMARQNILNADAHLFGWHGTF